MTGIKLRRSDIAFSALPDMTENVGDRLSDVDVRPAIATFEPIRLSDLRGAHPHGGAARHLQALPSAVIEDEINALEENLWQSGGAAPSEKRLRSPLLSSPLFSDPFTAPYALNFSFFFTREMQTARASTAEIANALHDALSNALPFGSTDTTAAFDIVMKKEKLTFIQDNFIVEALRLQSAEIVDSYIDTLVEQRDSMHMALADRELSLAIAQGEVARAEAARHEVDSLAEGRHRTQVEMAKAIAIADSARSVADTLDQFEMMLKDKGRAENRLGNELQQVSQLTDHWEDFIQKHEKPA